MFCRKESVVIHKKEHILSTNNSHPHLYTVQPPQLPSVFLPLSGFSLNTQRKQPVQPPNKLMCHAFLSDISAKLRKEAAGPLFFFLFFLPPVLVCYGERHSRSCDRSCYSIGICCSCGGRRRHSGSHEPLCGQSDHLDRDPTSAGRGGATQLQAREHRTSICASVCVCMQEKLSMLWKRHAPTPE